MYGCYLYLVGCRRSPVGFLLAKPGSRKRITRLVASKGPSATPQYVPMFMIRTGLVVDGGLSVLYLRYRTDRIVVDT